MARQSWVQDPKTGKLIPKDQYVRHEERAPMVIPDTPDYTSPVDGKLVSGRKQRREDLKRNNCHEYDPGERQDFLRNKNNEYREQAHVIREFLREKYS